MAAEWGQHGRHIPDRKLHCSFLVVLILLLLLLRCSLMYMYMFMWHLFTKEKSSEPKKIISSHYHHWNVSERFRLLFHASVQQALYAINRYNQSGNTRAQTEATLEDCISLSKRPSLHAVRPLERRNIHSEPVLWVMSTMWRYFDLKYYRMKSPNFFHGKLTVKQ